MSGFDLPPVIGYDQMFKSRPQGEGLGSRGIGQDLLPGRVDGGENTKTESKFESKLADSLGAMRELQNDVNDKYKSLLLGEDVELHDIMAAANKSEVMFNLMLEVRNKLVDAWEKLSRSAV